MFEYYWFITAGLMIGSYYIGVVVGYERLTRDVVSIINEIDDV